jgi:bacteriorhodopsin
MSAARSSRSHRTSHWLGIAMAVSLLILAGWAAFEGWHQPDQDDRNKYYIALFAPVAALAAYGLARALGLATSGGELADRCSVLILQRKTGKFA